MNYVDPDPLAGQIKQIFKLGWSHIPQVAHAGTENGVWRNVGGGVIDVVTLPDVGPATVWTGTAPTRRTGQHTASSSSPAAA